MTLNQGKRFQTKNHTILEGMLSQSKNIDFQKYAAVPLSEGKYLHIQQPTNNQQTILNMLLFSGQQAAPVSPLEILP